MKILHLCLAFFPCQLFGGPPHIVLTYAKGMRQRGHDVSILTTNILDHDKRMSTTTIDGEWEGIPVTYLNSHWRGRQENSLGFIWSTDLWRYRHIIQAADVIHIHENRHFLFLGGALLARHYRVPYIIQPHGAVHRVTGRRRLKRIYDTFITGNVMRHSKGIVILTDQERSYLENDFDLSDSYFHKILNPFDTDIVPPQQDKDFRKKYSIPDDVPLVLFLGRLHRDKGIDLLLKALQDLDGVYAAIVGPDYGFLEPAKLQAHEYGISDRVVFTGPIYETNAKFDAFRSADVFTHPARIDWLPTTILEALAVQTPVVLTDTFELGRLVHNRVGITVEYDAKQLCEGLKTIITQPDIARTFRQNAPAFMEEFFGMNRALDQIEELYTKVQS